jgi:hypothetical protein
MMKRVFVGVAAFAIAATSLNAQGTMAAPMKPWTFGVGVNLAKPTGDFGKAFNLGFGADGFVWWNFLSTMPALSLRGQVTYDRFSGKTINGFKIDAGNMIGGAVDLQYTFPMPTAPVKPYVAGGLGLYHTSGGGVEGVADGSSSTKFGFNVEGGIDFMVSTYTMFARVGFTSVQTEGTSSNFIPIGVGIKF